MAQLTSRSWKALFIGNDTSAFEDLRSVLAEILFENKHIKLHREKTLAGSERFLNHNPNTALVFIGQIQSVRSDGLKTAQFIREYLRKENLRIFMLKDEKNGPLEQATIENLDIHDARDRTKIQAREYTYAVLSALKSYLQARTIDYLKSELEKRVRSRTEDLEKSNIRLLEALNTLEEDQEAGRRIQYRLLPEQEKKFGNYRFSRYLISSTSLSGDFIDYFEINGTTLGFYIADVSGHGISSAFVTILLTNYIHTYLRNYRLENDRTILEPANLMDRLNVEFLREGLGKYLTIFYGIIRTDENKLSFSNAGQFPCPVVRSEAGITINTIRDWQRKGNPLGTKYSGRKLLESETHKNTVKIETKGPPVGMFQNAHFREYELILPAEFTMLMVSDGILEILPQTKLKDKLKYIESLMGTKSATIAEILGKLELSEEAQVPDDITFLLLKKQRGE